MLEAAPRILGSVDTTLAGLPAEHLRATGIHVETGVKFHQIEASKGWHRVCYSLDGRCGLFAIGDVAGNPMFAHWATAQALAVAQHILGMPTLFPKTKHNNLGRLRIVYRQDDGRIVGVHAFVEGAADLVGEAAVAIRNGLTLEQLASSIHPHPTLTEAFGILARTALVPHPHG